MEDGDQTSNQTSRSIVDYQIFKRVEKKDRGGESVWLSTFHFLSIKLILTANVY